jgi:hypothetical protein
MYRARLGNLPPGVNHVYPCGVTNAPKGRWFRSASVSSSPARYRCFARICSYTATLAASVFSHASARGVSFGRPITGKKMRSRRIG